jgi:hypothetical protein
MVPKNLNLKALELRIDSKSYKLHSLNYERIESECYQFGLKVLGLISEYYPTEISLYSYEKETIILTEKIIVLPNLDIQFNHLFYYGSIERKVTITNGNESKELSWSNQDSEIKYPLNDGILLIKIPYFRWRINNNEWRNEPINRKLWYKDFLSNGDLLEIDNPKDDEEISIRGKADGISFENNKNQRGKYEIGRAIYTNENKIDVDVYFSNSRNEKFKIFTVATKEHFIENPLSYNNGKVLWNVEDTFIGDKNNEFFLVVKSSDNNLRTKIGNKNSEIENLYDDVCEIQVKIKEKNIFLRKDSYSPIFEGKLLIGRVEKVRFKNKKIVLLSANCYKSKQQWIDFKPKYFIDKLQFVQEEENIYYSGQLCVIKPNGETRVLDTMINEKNSYDKINPVRIELRDNSTLWLVAAWEGGKDFIGNLFCDKKRSGICNIQQQDDLYSEINLYKFKEEENV